MIFFKDFPPHLVKNQNIIITIKKVKLKQHNLKQKQKQHLLLLEDQFQYQNRVKYSMGKTQKKKIFRIRKFSKIFFVIFCFLRGDSSLNHIKISSGESFDLDRLEKIRCIGKGHLVK